MASYGFKLYFSKSLDREEMRRRITAFPDCRPDPDGPDMYWADWVHFGLGNLNLAHTQKEIHHALGLEVGDFYVSLKVFVPDEEAFFQKWDRALDLLAFGEDAVALKEFGFPMLLQKDGKLTLDSSEKGMSAYYRDYVLSKRSAELAPFDELKEVD